MVYDVCIPYFLIMKSTAFLLGFLSLGLTFLTACQTTPENSELMETEASTVETFFIESERQDCVGVAPMKCLVVNGEFFYNSIEGFDFEPGFEYELTVEKQLAFGTDDPSKIPADASMYSYELLEELSKTAVVAENPIPDNCESWFDGCNNCRVMEGKMGACTRKFCSEELMQEAKCLKFADETAE